MIGRVTTAIVCLISISATAGEVSLEKDLLPLFQRSCGGCHEPDSAIRGAIKGGAFFNTKADLLEKVGGPIVAGKPDESGLIKVLDQTAKFGKRDLVMPPPNADGAKFSTEEIEKVKAWIKAGAKDN
jgi:mono/diheme cytochrome c family protein